jgi:hypothetical protein
MEPVKAVHASCPLPGKGRCDWLFTVDIQSKTKKRKDKKRKEKKRKETRKLEKKGTKREMKK